MVFAGYGLVTSAGTGPGRQLVYMLAFVVAHDFVVLPVAIAVGFAVARIVPAWARPAAHAALLASLALTVVALPFLVKSGTFPDNPSLLPLDYRRGLLIAIGATWLVAAVVALVRRHRRQAGEGH
jgi:hypothetical protein